MGIPLILSDVPDATPYIQYVATNGQTVFPYPFPITQDSDLIAIVNGVTLNTDAGYALSGQGNDTGGNLTFTLGQTSGAIITLYRDIPIERISQIAQNSGFSSTVFNAEYNNIYLILQQLEASIAQCLQIPNTNNPSPVTTLTAQNYALKYLSFDAFGNPTPAALTSAGVITQAIVGAVLYPVTAAETATGLPIITAFPYGDIRRYGVVPDSSGAAGANAAALTSLFAPTVNGPTGYFAFPNVSGTTGYYVSGTCPIRDGVHIDLQESVINVIGATTANDVNCGFFFALRDFTLENGSINTSVNTTLGSQGGGAIQLGFRGTGHYFTVFDNLLTVPMGNCVLRNLRINANNSTAPNNSNCAIGLLGGLVNVLVENVVINCNNLGTTLEGIAYEFGWATSPSGLSSTQTSHAHNMAFRNIKIINCGEYAMSLIGCYNCTVDGLKVLGSVNGFNYNPGEALFFNPWSGVDDVGAKRTMTLKNIVIEGTTGNAMSLTGAALASTGYLSGAGLTAAQQTDLMTFTLEGCSIKSSGGCLVVSGDITATNCKFDGGNAGADILGISGDCLNAVFTNCKVLNAGAGNGVNANLAGLGVWGTQRLKFITFTDGQVAGNTAGFIMSNVRTALIARNRIGYNALYDGIGNEATQANGVQLNANTTGVTCDSNYVTVTGGGTAYVIVGSPTDRVGNNLVNPLGTTSLAGNWDTEGVAQTSGTNLASKTSSINTVSKYQFRQAYNQTTAKLFIAQGASATSAWISVDGATTVTPS